jgi:ABC-type phosphate transport system permease subunit
MTKAGNRGLAGIPSAVLGLFVAGNLLVVVIGLLAGRGGRSRSPDEAARLTPTR